MKKNRIPAVICILLIFAITAGCSAGQATDGNTPVVLNEVAHSIFYAPQYVAIEKGFFEEEGIDLTLNTGYGADKVMTALISDNADIGLCGSEANIYAYANGQDDYAIVFAQLTQRAGNFLVSRKPMEDFDWNMLKGKKVLGGRAGGMPQMVFEYILKQNGIDPKTDLEIDQSIDFGLTAAAFTNNDADFTVEFEPHATLLEQEGAGYVVASLGEASGYIPYTSYCAKSSFLEKNPEIIKQFNKALMRGIDFVNTHTPKEVAEVIAPQFEESDTDTIAAIVARYQEQNSWKNDMTLTKESFDLLQNILVEAGELDAKVPYEKLVTTEFTR